MALLVFVVVVVFVPLINLLGVQSRIAVSRGTRLPRDKVEID